MPLTLSEEEELELLELEEQEAASQIGGGQQGRPSMAEEASTVVQGVHPRPMTSPSGMVKRLAMDTFEGTRPPINMEEAKRFLNPNLGQSGPNRFAQDISDEAAKNASVQAENFVQLPGVNKFPNVAGAVGAIGSLGFPLISPKGMQQASGVGKLASLGKTAENFIRNGGAKLGKAAISTISPASLDAVNARFDNPTAVKTALNREQMGNAVASSAKQLSQKIGVLEDAAKQVLSDKPVIPKSGIKEILNKLKSKFSGENSIAVSSETRAHIKELENVASGIESMNPLPDVPGSKNLVVGPGNVLVEKVTPPVTGRTSPNISEKQLKDLMDQYRNVAWDDPSRDAKKEIRKALDSVLKELNPEYKKRMIPVAENTKLQAIVNRKLSLKYDPTTGTYATDATAGKWTPAMFEGKKPETSMALKRLGEATGNDLMKKAKFTNYREQFEGGKTQGSRMVQLGRHVAGVPGAVLGAAIDKMGGNASGFIIDMLAKIPTIPSMGAKEEKALILALGQVLARRKEKQNAR